MALGFTRPRTLPPIPVASKFREVRQLEDNIMTKPLKDVTTQHRQARLSIAHAREPAERLPPVEAVEILTTSVAVVEEQSFLLRVDEWLARRTANTAGVYVVFRDVHGVVRALDEPALADAHRGAFMNVPDGAPLVWVCRFRGRRAGRVTGTDTLEAVCRAGLAKGWRHAFYGATPEVLRSLVAALEASYPGIEIADAVSPPFRPLTDVEMEEQIRRLAVAKPDIIWVGLGCPKQEIWMARYARHIPGAISMGVGAAFDFRAGAIKRAPPFIRQFGLEFLYRISQEPGRLAGRYFRVIPRFMLGIFRQEARRLFRSQG
ncbi:MULTISPECIES: WecB/TagA/CpsF family glycosyltransferase [unclassified Mesorhizobium]|uniref:WecB/TagA/CpsF family glycosyltransferase n=2 Tax=unclassified Mesorhizobium TaxID=325217 RepID=UPI0012EB4F09|nr:WecB/TagA/CpsF family glycosyltransferase [Mesorhizobium sp. LSJC280B00]